MGVLHSPPGPVFLIRLIKYAHKNSLIKSNSTNNTWWNSMAVKLSVCACLIALAHYEGFPLESACKHLDWVP